MAIQYGEPLVKEYVVTLVDRVRFWKEDSYRGPIKTARLKAKSDRGLIDLFLLDPVWMGISVRRIDDSIEGRIPEKECLVN